jgi:biopolymer transport protein ExbD
MKVKQPSKDDVQIDMAPMIDMVFLLLIFFMVASVVARPDKVKVDIPTAQAAKVPDDIQGRMIVSVDANSQIYVDVTPVSLQELQDEVAAELEKNPNLRVFIRADKSVPFKTTKNIMIACGEVGATDLIYATYEE